MKTSSKFFALCLMMALFASSAFAQVTASASASATILTPIAIANRSDMNFGNLAVNNTAGTIVLSTAGARTANGGVTFLNGNAGTVSAASFEVTGLEDATYSITLPPASITLTNGTSNLTVDTWTSSPTPTGTLSSGGNQILDVGATLNVPASSSAGVYTGPSFSVTVNYN